jgi:uncharacterized cupredoxin-like copper-binding protein
MYNNELSTRVQLPSSLQLLRSTIIAALVAGGLLIAVVMPAEYGIDPTGIGKLTGLQKMGQIKMTLAREALAANATAAKAAQQSNASPAAASEAAAPPHAASPQAVTSKPAAGAVATQKDQTSLTLKPGESAEVKITMPKDTKLQYSWSVSGGHVNFDTHGEPFKPPAGFYHGYGKGKASKGDKGTLVAAFDGQHGWFWRNRSEQDAVLTLNTQGGYTQLKRVK